MLPLVAQAAAAALAIVWAGTVLARMGDLMAARTRLGGAWVGAVFMAAATSLPEIATDVAAVHAGAPDLAVGDLFGSSMANMAILAIVTFGPAGTELFRRATLDHALYAALAIGLTTVAVLHVAALDAPQLWGISVVSILLLAGYVAGSRVAFRLGVVAPGATTHVELSAAPALAGTGGSTLSMRGIGARFIGAAVALLVVAPSFAHASEGLAVMTGLGTTVVGTWLVGVTTSLPEFVTSVAAVRLRAYDLAVGNLFGSNAFNMAVFAALDAVHRSPVLEAADEAHVVSGLVAVVMMALALAALVYRARGRAALLEPSGTLILLTYAAGLALVVASSRP